MSKYVLGIDIGNVLISPTRQESDTSFLGTTPEQALETPPYDGMFDEVPSLVSRFNGLVYIVSKARPRMQAKSAAWLDHHKFWERTGIPKENLRFCLERADKAPIAKELGITHFIDDRQEVLDHMNGIVPYQFLFGPQQEEIKSGYKRRHCLTWKDVAEAVLGTLRSTE